MREDDTLETQTEECEAPYNLVAWLSEAERRHRIILEIKTNFMSFPHVSLYRMKKCFLLCFLNQIYVRHIENIKITFYIEVLSIE